MADLWENRALFLKTVAFTEFRTIEQDEIPLSPAKHYQMVSMNFRWINDLEAASEAVREVQRILHPFEYRVNWGTFWHSEPEFGLFNTFEDDLDQLKKAIEIYPDNKFVNCWVERVLYGKKDCTHGSKQSAHFKTLEPKDDIEVVEEITPETPKAQQKTGKTAHTKQEKVIMSEEL